MVGRRIFACASAAFLAGVALFAACTESAGPNPPPPPPPPPPGLIVSNPIPIGALAIAGNVAASRSPASSAAADSVVYVAVTPGTAPSGRSATVRRIGSASSFTTPFFDGGFDPVPVNARAGDSIDVVITDAGGGLVSRMRLAVAATRAPVVVRTQPPPRKRDHPLNAAIVVVFSEPIAGTSVTPGAIQLLRGQTVVAGTARFLDPSLDANHVSVEFTPDQPLDASTNYELVVTQQIRDLTGDMLAAPDSVAFTTSQSSVGPPATIRVILDSVVVLAPGASIQLAATVLDSAGNLLTDQPVTWSVTNSTIATVSGTGLLQGLASGLTRLVASAGQAVTGFWVLVNVPVGPPASLNVSPSTATVAAGDMILLTATVRDASGQVLAWYVEWSTSDSTVARAEYGGNPGNVGQIIGVKGGTVVITGMVPYTPARGTATVTVGPPVPVASLSVTPDSVTLVVKAKTRFTTTLRDATGRLVSGRRILWTSDNLAIATVDSNGSVTAVGTGSVAIVATIDGVADTAKIGVQTITFASVRAAGGFTCGLTTDQSAYCWGNADVGLGRGNLSQWAQDCIQKIDSAGYRCEPVPQPVVGGLKFSYIEPGWRTCGITAAHVAYCWGYNPYGNDQFPMPEPSGLPFTQISAGNQFSCGVTTDGAAHCWGWNDFGQLGDGTTISRSYMQTVVGGLTFGTVTAGLWHTCGLTIDGSVYCWGGNVEGELGDGTTTNKSSPVPVAGGLALTSLATFADNTCGLTIAGVAYCWGRNLFGGLGDNTTTSRNTPTPLAGGLTFKVISVGGEHSCGLTTEGLAYCWGWNAEGQLGDGTTLMRMTPVPVLGGLIFATISAGYVHTCGLTTSGVLYCWGNNEYGELGDGFAEVRSAVPVRVAGQP